MSQRPALSPTTVVRSNELSNGLSQSKFKARYSIHAVHSPALSTLTLRRLNHCYRVDVRLGLNRRVTILPRLRLLR